MKYLPLLWSGLWRKPVRTVLTIASIAVAFLLFGVLHGVIDGFQISLAKLSDTRLRVTNRANIFEPLPIAYKSQITGVAGVHSISYFSLFAGYYQDPKNGFSIAAVEPDTWIDIIPNFRVPAEQRRAMHTTRTGALVGGELMKRYGWHLGDRITLHSIMWVNKNGSPEWPFDIVGIVNGGPDDDPAFATEMYFNYDYLDSARSIGTGTVNQFIVSLDDGTDPNGVSVAIDRLFANSHDETTTLNERAWFTANARQIGDVNMFVNSIIGAVLFTLLFLAGNTMSQSVRDRQSELGVLKAMGFGDSIVWTLVVGESIVLSVVAAAIGLGIAAAIFPAVFRQIGGAPLSLPAGVYAIGCALAVLLAMVSASIPAFRARRLTVVEALGGH